MDAIYRQFFTTMSQFHKLRLRDLLPDMTKMDCMTLMTIAHSNCGKEEGGITTSGLAERMQVKSSAISRTLKGLEEKGLIERTVNKADRRNTYVELTEQGKLVLAECKNTMDELAKAIFSQMKPEDIKQMIGYLDELYRIAKNEIEIRSNKKEREQEDE